LIIYLAFSIASQLQVKKDENHDINEDWLGIQNLKTKLQDKASEMRLAFHDENQNCVIDDEKENFIEEFLNNAGDRLATAFSKDSKSKENQLSDGKETKSSWLDTFQEWKEDGLNKVKGALENFNLTEIELMVKDGVHKATTKVSNVMKIVNDRPDNLDVMVTDYGDEQKYLKKKLDCINVLIGSELKIQVNQNEDIGISCKDETCKKCLLWIYLSALKERGGWDESGVQEGEVVMKKRDEDIVQSALIP